MRKTESLLGFSNPLDDPHRHPAKPPKPFKEQTDLERVEYFSRRLLDTQHLRKGDPAIILDRIEGSPEELMFLREDARGKQLVLEYISGLYRSHVPRMYRLAKRAEALFNVASMDEQAIRFVRTAELKYIAYCVRNTFPAKKAEVLASFGPLTTDEQTTVLNLIGPDPF